MQDARDVNTLADMPLACAPPLASLTPLKALRAALAVARHGSAAQAGAALSKSATSVTRAVQTLEAALGMPLFERHARGMVPTAAGRAVVARALRAFEQLDLGACELHGTAAAGRRDSRLARLAGERLLEVLVAVADTGSATLAAQRLGLTQPAVSQALRELEHLAGAVLVERGARSLHLTDAGAILLRRVRLALMELRVAGEETASLDGLLHGRVTVASLPYSSVELVPQAAARCLRRHPRLQLAVIDGTYDTLIGRLRSAEIDMIVGTLRPADADDLEQEVLVDDSLCVACRAGHPHAAAPHLALRDLADAPWVLPLPGTAARASFEAAFRAEGLALPPVRLEVHNPVAVRALLLDGDYLALLSAHQIRAEVAAGQLAVLPVALRDARRTIGLTLRRGGAHAPGVLALREALRAAAGALAGAAETAASAAIC